MQVVEHFIEQFMLEYLLPEGMLAVNKMFAISI